MIAICYSKGKRANELKVEKRKNTKASPMESMQYVSLPGEGGGSSKMAEGRLHYVRTQESLRLLAIPLL